MTDSSPANSGPGTDSTTHPKPRENQKKILKGLDASWNMSYDEENGIPAGATGNAGKSAAAAPRGARKDTQPSWGFGGEDEA